MLCDECSKKHVGAAICDDCLDKAKRQAAAEALRKAAKVFKRMPGDLTPEFVVDTLEELADEAEKGI